MVWLGLSGHGRLQLQHHVPAVLGGGDAPHGQVPRRGFLPEGLDYDVKQEEGEAAALGGGVRAGASGGCGPSGALTAPSQGFCS